MTTNILTDFINDNDIITIDADGELVFMEDVCEDYIEQPKRKGRKKVNNEYNGIIYEERGEYLTKVLGLDKINRNVNRKPVEQKKTAEQIAEEAKNIQYTEAQNKKWNFKFNDFVTKFDSNYGWIITHKSWTDTWITNADSYITTKEEANKFIKDYIDNSNKPLMERNSFIFHLVA